MTSKIPRFDRNNNTGAITTENPSLSVSNNSPKHQSRIPLPISPRKESSQRVSTDPIKSSTDVVTEFTSLSSEHSFPPGNEATLPLDHSRMPPNRLFDIREVSTPSHFDDSELDRISPIRSADTLGSHSLPEQEGTQEEQDDPFTSSHLPDAYGEEERPVSSRTPRPHSTPVSHPLTPDHLSSQSAGFQSHLPEDCDQAQESAAVPDQSLPISRDTPSEILSPQREQVPPSFQLSPTLPPDPILPFRPSNSDPVPHSTTIRELPPADTGCLTHSSPEHDSTLNFSTLLDSPNHFIPISTHSPSYGYPPTSSTNQWTLDSPVIRPMLPPLPSPTSNLLHQDIRPYYNLRASIDSPDLTSMSYGTPMDTPSPVPSLLSTPDDLANFPAFPDSDGMYQQLNALRQALDDSTRERARLVEIITQRDQEMMSQRNYVSYAGEFQSEVGQLREECARLENENARLQNAHTRMGESDTRSALAEAMRARNMLAQEFEHLKAYQLQLEEELRVERERITISPHDNSDQSEAVASSELESVRRENSGLREEINQLTGEQETRVELEQEVERLRLELQELDQSTSSRVRENEAYFLSQLQEEQASSSKLRQTNRQLAQELNEHHSSSRLIQTEFNSLSAIKEGLEEDLISSNQLCSQLQQQLTEWEGKLSEMEVSKGLLGHVDLDVLDTLKRELERQKLEREGVELKLNQEIEQTLHYMQGKREAEEEVARLSTQLQELREEAERENVQELHEALQTEQRTNLLLSEELRENRVTLDKLQENLNASLVERRHIEREYTLLEHSCAQMNAAFEQKIQESEDAERVVNNMQVEASMVEDRVKALEDSKQALSSLISLLSQIISELSAALRFSQTDHQSFTQEMKSLFDEVSSPGGEESTPQAFVGLKRMIQRQGLVLEQLVEKESRLHAYTEEVRLLRAKLEKLERDKLACEENILELVANNASLQTRVNFNTAHPTVSESFSLSQILPPDVFSNVTQSSAPSEPILQSQLELTGQASPLPDPPHDYFSGELRETRRELKTCQDLIIKLKQDLAKSHGCILSLQAANEEVSEESRGVKRCAEAVESEVQTLREEAEENVLTAADKVARISYLERVFETVQEKLEQGAQDYRTELDRINSTQTQQPTPHALEQPAQTEFQVFLNEELTHDTSAISLSDEAQLPLLLDALLRSRRLVLELCLKRYHQVMSLSQQLHSSVTQLADTRRELEVERGQRGELTQLKESVERSLETEKNAVAQLDGELNAERGRRQLKEEEIQDMERIVTSLRHELEQEKFLHHQQSSDRESSLITQIEELKASSLQLKRDRDLLDNRMQHLQITSSNQVEQLNAQLCQAQTEVTRLQGANNKLSERVKHNDASLTQLSTSHTSEIEALSQEMTQNKNEVMRCHAELQTQQRSVSEKEQLLAVLVGDLEEMRSKKQDALAQYESLLESKMSALNRKLEDSENENRSLCEENSRIKSTFETELPNLLESNKEERGKLQGTINDLSNKNAQLTQALSEQRSALSRADQEIQKAKVSSQEKMDGAMRSKRELEEELGRLKQEYAAEIASLQREIPLDLFNGAEDTDLVSRDSDAPSLPALVRKICHENGQLKLRCHDLEISILEGRTDSLPGTSTPDIQDHSELLSVKKPSYVFSDARTNDRVLRTKRKQLELLRLKLGYTLRELRMYKVLKSAYDLQIDELKRMLSESGDKYEGCIQKITELEQLCFQDD